MNGYFLSTPVISVGTNEFNVFCVECSSIASDATTSLNGGSGCMHCTDNTGCQQCMNGFNRVWESISDENGNVFEFYRCV